MATPEAIPPELQKLLPGVLGSAGALLWLKGSWVRRMAMVGLGSVASYYGAPHIATMFGMGEGLAGFLVGLFGMSVVDSIFKTWADLGFTPILREFIRVRLGLSARED